MPYTLNRILATILFFALFCSNIKSQDGFNNYASITWLRDNLKGDSIEFNELLILSEYIPDSYSFLNPSPEDDSNSISRIQFQVGSNANQHFKASLRRPISKAIEINLDLIRLSHQGWMTRSFYRSTMISGEVLFNKPKRLRTRVLFDFANQDRELNGGLRSSQYGTDELEQQGFQTLFTDVYLLEAFNRSSSFETGADFAYSVFKSSSSHFDLTGSALFGRQRFNYVDDSPVEGYYSSKINGFFQDSYADSTLIQNLQEKIGFQFESKDSLYGILIDGGIKADQYQLANDFRELNTYNLSAYADLIANYGRLHLIMYGQQYFAGFNSEDQIQGAEFKYDINPNQTDSSYSWTLALKVKRVKSLPNIRYYQYRSTVKYIQTNRQQQSEQSAEISLGTQGPRFGFSINSGINIFEDYQYFDSTATPRIALDPVVIRFVGAIADYESKYFRYRLSMRVQTTNNDSVMSVPTFFSSSDVSTRFPLFDKRLDLNIGFRTKFFTSYYASGYHGFLDEYYQQSSQKFGDFMQVDAYASVEIKKTRVYFEARNLNDDLFLSPLLVGPNFPSVPRYLVFGIDWKFLN